MVKCNACGRFISASAEVAKCGKCPMVYHRPCVGLNDSSRVATSWCCPNCKPKKTKGDNAETPVKALHSEGSGDEDPMVTTLPPSCYDTPTAPSTGTGDANSLVLQQIQEVREELRAFHLEFQTYRAEMVELKVAVAANATKLESLDTRIISLESKYKDIQSSSTKDLESTVMQLRQELNERDQLSLANDIEISGLPEDVGENTPHLAIVIGAKLGVKLEDRDMIYAERVGQRREVSTLLPGDPITSATGSRPRPLVIRFTRRALRDDLLRAARVRRGITSADVGLPGTSRRFYVNERLSKHNRQVFYNARQLCRDKDWKFVWTKSGFTYVRQAQGKTAYRATNMENLNRIFGKE